MERGTIGNIYKTGISYDNLIYKFETMIGHPVIIKNKKNNSIKEYFSVREAARDICVSAWSISKFINTDKLLKDMYLITKEIDKLKSIPRVITSDTRSKLASRSKGVSVKVYGKYNNLVNIFSTLKSAAKHFGVSCRTIHENLNTNIPHNNLIFKSEISTVYPIMIINKENNSVREYFSTREAAKDICVSATTVLRYINTNKLLRGTYLITRK